MINQIPANTWLGISEKIKEFFEENVAKDYYLQLQDTEDEPQYREPYVDLQTLPHKNFVPPDWIQPTNAKPYHAPYILIQTHSVRINDDLATMSVRAIFGVYSSENNTTSIDTLKVPDNKAYVDLMNVMQKALEAINKNRVFGNAQLADTEITAEIYDTENPTWPFAYGYITFDVQYYTSTTNFNL